MNRHDPPSGPRPAATGQWVAASAALGRPVPIGQPYPHICATPVTGPVTGRRYTLRRRDCAACTPRGQQRPTNITAKEPTVMLDTLPVLSAALALAAQGLPVFLLGRSKRPVANCAGCPRDDPQHDPASCDHLTCHGFYAASTDPDRIAALFDAVPYGLLAIRTGSTATITPAGLVVVDIDPRNGGRVIPGLMPPTRAVSTGSGGWHLYYAHPGGPLSAKVAGLAGVDLKADGGYVVAPPSVHPHTGQPYRWVGDRPVAAMPTALVERCRPVGLPQAVPAVPAVPGQRSRSSEAVPAGTAWRGGTAQAVPAALACPAGGISSPAALLAAHLAAVAHAPQGTRRTTLYGAARGVARMVAAGALTYTDAYAALYTAGRDADQNDRDTRAAIAGGFHAESVAVATEGTAA
ncbi:MAG TPA: bifunctional DNA primase/polymerase [Micromonosporaceae bacterium]|nr:bifunctional DNA primase/polymerase [Micromonosporaceae bacterium]